METFDDFYNLASVQDNSEVRFYDDFTRTLEDGDQQKGDDYLVHLTELMHAQMNDDYFKLQWCVKRNAKNFNIIDYLEKRMY